MQYINLHTPTGKQLIPSTTILRIESVSNYSRVYFTNNKHFVVAKLLRWFEESFTHSNEFIRVHNSHLINKDAILSVAISHHPTITLTNGDNIQISKRRLKYVKEELLSKAI